MTKFDITMPPKHYFGSEYNTIRRFISYFYQIDLIRKINPNKILEIGIGNKTVSNYIKHNGMKVDTCDFDKELNPDHIADIRNLPFKDKSYDLVVACEILEHIPWEDVDKALIELHRVSKKHVLISIPYSSSGFELTLHFPLIQLLFKIPFFNIFLRIPHFFTKTKPKGEHRWEMGRKYYPKRKIRKLFKNHFTIEKEVRPILNHYHQFFILKKINKS